MIQGTCFPFILFTVSFLCGAVIRNIVDIIFYIYLTLFIAKLKHEQVVFMSFGKGEKIYSQSWVDVLVQRKVQGGVTETSTFKSLPDFEASCDFFIHIYIHT